MSPRVTGTALQSARERADAARALLSSPLLTAAAADEFALVRLHAPALRSMFKNLLGYSLVVESTFARLVKAPVSADGPARPARRPDNSAFTPVAYTYLALLCAALLAPGTGEQTLISALIDQVRSDAASVGVTIGDTLPERRALVAAINHLVSWGVLSETDGTAAGWSERRDEALLTIHRPALPHLLARPLSGIDSPDGLFAIDPQLSDQPRRSIRRKLVENPLVRREELTDGERDVLSRERTELTRQLADNFGLTLEVRAEGALAYDSAIGGLTDVSFPGSGTVKQAALLLVAELIDQGQQPDAVAGPTITSPVAGLAVTWSQVDVALAGLIVQHQRAWGAGLVEQPQRLRDEVVDLLTDVSLATTVPGGVVIHPAAARYRPRPHAAAPTRAALRHAAGSDLEGE